MKKLYIIILDSNVDSTIVKSRISELNKYYSIYNQYIVYTDCPNAQTLYEKLVPSSTTFTGIVVFGTTLESLTYWGYSDKGLWDWLKSLDSSEK